jgi:hypothetical protein
MCIVQPLASWAETIPSSPYGRSTKQVIRDVLCGDDKYTRVASAHGREMMQPSEWNGQKGQAGQGLKADAA